MTTASTPHRRGVPLNPLNPLEAFKSQIDAIKTSVRMEVETAILRENTRFLLSRLATLDASRKDAYAAALAAIGE